jgi:YVTN family beta-propeller protein
MIKQSILLSGLFFGSILQLSAQKIINTFHIKSAGSWDYLAINAGQLYVSHGTHVNILDKQTGDSLGIIEGTTGVHGIAFDASGKKGFTSNGKLNNVFVFDPLSFKVTAQISTGQNPDAILYDPFSKMIVVCDGRSNDITVIDPVTEKVISTIAVGGKPETLVTDEAGKWFVNIEDKSEIVVIDAQSYSVLHHWKIAPGEEPSGLAIDRVHKKLFAGCSNNFLIVVDAQTGKVIEKLPIGAGCDGVAYDDGKIYSSNGEDGTLSIISSGKVKNFQTKKGARTLVVDPSTHKIYTSAGKSGVFEVLVIAR